MFEYKISSFFLILVLLLSVTNLPTFSTTQLNSDSNNLNGLSINLLGVAFADHKDSHKVSHDDSYDDSHDDSYDDSHGKKDKVTICHIPPGNPDNAHTKNVSGNAMNAHLAHGDSMGECPDNGDQDTTTTTGGDDTVDVTTTGGDDIVDVTTAGGDETYDPTTTDNEELSQLIDENKKLKEDLEKQEEQIDDLNEQIDYLSELLASIQGFFGNLFG